ncbi:metalloregulator ArsR/SmtB family transcription factor [Mesobacterium sp. TK19101]|uniref:Metalloregulator ArsR/SmtB family transcription factor n=1 Tax=Mesobacterium hydrothermale TaxID=3111907 RepID=A0ABU6HH86_9RHOB|nr:metalloregulator ArsR/SmtB family transcription factor [Mesobacterium sp. TK19101]MEC3861825.1 metalloregulator ArsR/SmtB family transcription factor [Mesobacterium sp. TK19101]
MTSHLTAVFAALADPTRRAVIERLTRGAAPVTELYAPHDMALPTFLRHLKVLEDSGLVRSEKTGRVRTVRIEARALAEVETWLRRQRRPRGAPTDRLESLALRLEADFSDRKDTA